MAYECTAQGSAGQTVTSGSWSTALNVLVTILSHVIVYSRLILITITHQDKHSLPSLVVILV